jgi:hypothetical protein
LEHWRGETLAMGLLYESAAVEFWKRVIEGPAEGLQMTPDGSAPRGSTTC